jgi:hypothetical protein
MPGRECKSCGHPAYIGDVDVGFYARNVVNLKNGERMSEARFERCYQISACQAWQRLNRDKADVAKLKAHNAAMGRYHGK